MQHPVRASAARSVTRAGGTGGALYIAYFGLSDEPFSLTPDPRYLYMSQRHREALAHLLYGIGEGGGFVQLTGEVGTGKTTLCRCLLEQLPAHVDAALILNPALTEVELVAAICDELRVTYPAGTHSLKVLVDALNAHLLAAYARGRRTVLIVDEAQNLARPVLEQIRLLTNLETARDKLLQIILIGQPELQQVLEQADLRQLAQRITARYHLLPLSRAETAAYIEYRLAVGGQKRALFAPAAVRAIHAAAGGVPRLINILCDRALLGAYAGGQPAVDRAIVRRAAREVFGPRAPRRYGAWTWFAGAALGALLVAGAWLGKEYLWEDIAYVLRRPAPNAADPSAVHPPMTSPAVEAPAGTRALREVLADPALSASEDAAFVRLLALWKIDARGSTGAACERAQALGLRCVSGQATWATLRAYNRPVMLELADTGGRAQYAVVTAATDAVATLELAGHGGRYALSELASAWRGNYVLVWRSPISAEPLRPAARGADVVWLRGRMFALDGRGGADTGDTSFYDNDLHARVAAFQRAHGLNGDGVVDNPTLLHLIAGVADAATPSLRSSPALASP